MWLQVHKKAWKGQQEGQFEPFGGIYGTLRLGLGQKKWRDLPREGHLVHNVGLRTEPPMTVEMLINVTSSRYLHWESHLVHFFGFEIGSSNGMSDGNGNFKLEGSPLGE